MISKTIYQKRLLKQRWCQVFDFQITIFRKLEYIDIRKLEQRQKSFENYHGLVERLATTKSMDAQTAIIYELRNYPEYKDVSIRILDTYKVKWKIHEMLYTELNLTLEELQSADWMQKKHLSKQPWA